MYVHLAYIKRSPQDNERQGSQNTVETRSFKYLMLSISTSSACSSNRANLISVLCQANDLESILQYLHFKVLLFFVDTDLYPGT